MEVSSPAPEWLNYHHLRYFHAVAQAGSIRGAAEKLHASQPAICAQVKQLEQALGEPLYRRAGRSFVLTDFGRVIHQYADEIFTLGQELLNTARRAPTARRVRLNVGIVDSFPKLLTLDILRPALAQQPAVQVTCEEGKIDDLLGRLAAHRLDALLTDELPSSSAQIRTFNHPLLSTGIAFCATPALARRLAGRFPACLQGAPMLLPAQNIALRRDVERWFRARKVEPETVGEFDDAALAQVVATEGHGVTMVPTVALAEARERYGLVSLGETEECQIHLYLITADRRIEHPTVARLVEEAQRRNRREEGKARRTKKAPAGQREKQRKRTA